MPNYNRRVYGELGDENKPPRRRRPGRFWNWKTAVKGVAILLLAGFVLATGAYAWVSRDLPDPNKLTDRQVAQSTKIYDRTGTHLLYEVYQNQKRTIVDLSQMSPWIPKATIAVEDKHFYEHNGVRITSILRAGFNDLIGRRAGSGGASTLTQQLVKNTIVGNERSIFRKIKEAILALRLEKDYSKEDILKMYLNEIPYGSTNYGVEAASQSYFHKSAKDLSLAESATLAALIQAPSRYLNDLNALHDRRNLVLSLMADQGYVSAEEKNTAQNEALRIYRNGGILAAPHFVLYVKKLLADQFGENLIDTGGLKVITSLDYDKQQLAEKIVKENGDRFAKEANANNAALVAIDPKTAQILSLVGSRDFYNDQIDGQYDVAVLGRRQPGSSFKPFVYTAAFEKGYTPDTVLYDVTTNFDDRNGQKYAPKDFDGKERGLVTIRKALQGSLNIPAVKTLYLVGVENAIDFAKRFGYTTFTGDYGLSLVLGGGEVNLLEHTNAYATLADDGVYHQTAAILSVQDKNGNMMYQWQPTDGTSAVTPELAAEITGVLSDDPARQYVFGAHSTLTLPDRPVAAKTGTTNDNKDAWTLGFTPSLTAGVWVGNTIPSSMKSGGNKLAGVIWNQFMQAALKGTPPEMFPSSTPNSAVKPVLRGADGGIKIEINTLTGRIATSGTPLNLIQEKTFLPAHEILQYVRKDDPRGAPPDDPSADPQYDNWESGLQDWVARQQKAGVQVTLEDPPAQLDSDAQSSDLTPTLDITSPASGQIINTRQIEINVRAAAPRGVSAVRYQIDGDNAGESSQYPFSFTYYAQKLSKGVHTLTATASDDLGNSIQKQVSFDLEAELDPPSFDWFDKSPLAVSGADYPRTFNLVPFRWEEMKDIAVYLDSSVTGEKQIYDFNHLEDKLFNGQLMFTWKHDPGAGSYTLRGVMTDNNGKTMEKDLIVEVK